MTTPTKTDKGEKEVQVLSADLLAAIPWLVHGFSTRHGGVSQAYGGNALNLGITAEDTRAAVEQNRRLFLKAIGACDSEDGAARASDPDSRGKDPRPTRPCEADWPLVAMRQVHSSLIHRIQELPEQRLHGDGLITDRASIVLAVRVADCLPILIADPVHRAIGAFHAGWRGTLGRIVEKGVGELRRWFGSRPEDLVIAIGPGIHRCCYEVSEELREKFACQFQFADRLFEDVFDSDSVRKKYPLLFLNQRAPGHGEPARKLHLDLVEANRRQLLDAGVKASNIWSSDLCTSCRTDIFFSHRKEKGVTGRMMGGIAIKK